MKSKTTVDQLRLGKLKTWLIWDSIQDIAEAFLRRLSSFGEGLRRLKISVCSRFVADMGSNHICSHFFDFSWSNLVYDFAPSVSLYLFYLFLTPSCVMKNISIFAEITINTASAIKAVIYVYIFGTSTDGLEIIFNVSENQLPPFTASFFNGSLFQVTLVFDS